ncbi:hypothetical protein [Cognatishimia sp. MH4019]|uniref:hypothetical protein n=1 Tax=Cognatishimia sp. MH4019 TaxID=2854030 RepID=UPI001CD3C0A5|nr:hypothetical protein [Cognatishimia sp. MH4019]
MRPAAASQQWLSLFARHFFQLVAAFYAYGALIHILNIASMTGFVWAEAPLKWQLLDIIYLVLDLVIVVGLLRRSWIGVLAFFLAAISQIALYTVFRDWILDVPAAFQRSPQDIAYLDGLVIFHIATCFVMGIATLVRRRVNLKLVEGSERSLVYKWPSNNK